jgi:hypothetical protein
MLHEASKVRRNNLITSPSFPMTRFAGWRSHDRGQRPEPADVTDGGIDGTKGQRPHHDGSNTEGVTVLKAGDMCQSGIDSV